MKVTIKITENQEEILSKVLDEGIYRIGRSDLADICLNAEGVSRSHVELRITPTTIYMTNMSSTSKVKVNGKNLETAELADGDQLTIGPYKATIIFGAEAVQPVAADNNLENPVGSSFANAEIGGEGEEKAPSLKIEPDAGEAVPPPMPSGEVVLANPDDPSAQGTSGLMRPDVEGTAALNRAETVVELKPVVAKLVFVEGPKAGEELFLEAYEISFGRSKRADIFVDDEKLSRIHAKITRVGMGYRLIDLNSRNGTYVNGMRVLEHPLSSFDTIEFGSTKIKFLIHDVVSSDVDKGALIPVPSISQAQGSQAGRSLADKGGQKAESTRSLQYDPVDPVYLDYQRAGMPGPREPVFGQTPPPVRPTKRPGLSLARIGMLFLILSGAAYLIMPGDKGKIDDKTPQAQQTTKPPISDVRIPPEMSKEFKELPAETQRAIEGYYNNALRYADKEQYEEAVASLRRIHEVIPYYKQSKDLLEQYEKRIEQKKLLIAAEKAKNDDKQELSILLEEGLDYLKQGDFDRAGEAFNSALLLDPNNQTASKGLKAAEYRVRSLEQVPIERDPEKEKRAQVGKLFEQAVTAFSKKAYQDAIDKAEQIRKIELKGDTQYLNEAKQIIDRAHALQKEEFEPFLIQAKEKFAEGDYNTSRDTCEEMLKRDPAYDEARECVLKAKKQLNRLAKEAYTHGYILESMNRLEEAKQYWNRAKNYVRKGDDYYDKVMKKLEYYQ